jgi:hypothetical protein
MPHDTPQPPNPTPPHRQQFTLWTVLVGTTVVAVILAVARAFGREIASAVWNILPILLALLACLGWCGIAFVAFFAIRAMLDRLERTQRSKTAEANRPPNEVMLQIMMQIGRTKDHQTTVYKITELLGISEIQAQYFLDELERTYGFLDKDELPGSSRPTRYSLTQEGRRFLAERRLA